jgi:AcrR family transcriptional regulator
MQVKSTSARGIAPPPTRIRLSAPERRSGIVAAVLALACDRGPDAITTQAIADRIGVTQAAVFRHFPDKDAIWLAVFAWIGETLGATFEAAVAAPGTPLEKLERAFLAHAGFVAANPGVARVLFHELQYPGDSPVRRAVRTMIGDYRRRIEALMRTARTAGELAPDLDVALAPVMFIGAMQGLVIQASLAGDAGAVSRRAPGAWRLLLDGYRGKRAAGTATPRRRSPTPRR